MWASALDLQPGDRPDATVAAVIEAFSASQSGDFADSSPQFKTLCQRLRRSAEMLRL